MKTWLNTLLLCLGLALAPTLWADHGPHRHGQQAGDKLDSLSMTNLPPCCPTEGAPTQATPAGPTNPAVDAKPCASGPGHKACDNPGPGGCPKHAGNPPCAHGEGCHPMAGRHGGGGHCGKSCPEAAELQNRVHQLERRLDLMQRVLESLLERPQAGRHMGGQRGPD